MAGAMDWELPAEAAAAGVLAPLRNKAEAQGSRDFSPMGQGRPLPLAAHLPACELTRTLAADALARMRVLGAA